MRPILSTLPAAALPAAPAAAPAAAMRAFSAPLKLCTAVPRANTIKNKPPPETPAKTAPLLVFAETISAASSSPIMKLPTQLAWTTPAAFFT